MYHLKALCKMLSCPVFNVNVDGEHKQSLPFYLPKLCSDTCITCHGFALMKIAARRIARGVAVVAACGWPRPLGSVAVSLLCFGIGSILAVSLGSSGAPAISWCLTLDFIGLLQWLQAVLRDIDCPAPPRQAPHNADEWTRGPAKSN